LRMTYPPHPHTNIDLRVTFSQPMRPITYAKMPPLDKVLTKLGAAAQESSVQGLKGFLETKSTKRAADATLPNLAAYAELLRTHFSEGSMDLFPLVDLLRAALADPRVSGWFAEEKAHETLRTVISYAASSSDLPYALRLVTLQTICNLFTSPLFPPHLTSQPLSTPVISFITGSLLDKAHSHSRVAASSLAFNIAVYVQKERTSGREVFAQNELVELTASIVESLKEESESKEAVRGLVLSLALLVYCLPSESEVGDVLNVLEAASIVKAKGSKDGLGDKTLCVEVGKLLDA